MGGTVRQPDANITVMTGEGFELRGGFWPGVAMAPEFGVGDLNCDDSVNGLDIDAFMLALTDPAGYTAAYLDCDALLADCNADGSVNGLDIDAFVARLVGG